MKKRLFFLLLAAMMMPLAMNAQHNASVHIDTTIDACVSYIWPVNGVTYTASGAYTAIVGDTLYILDLNIHPQYTIMISTPIAGGCTYQWGDSTLTTSGLHTQTFKSVDNCDSIVTINLNLTGTATKLYTVTACDSLVWKGDTLRTTGMTMITDTTNPACDSLLTMDLTIIQHTQKTYDTVVTACNRTRFRFSASQSWTTVTVDGTVMTSEAYGNTTAGRRIMHPRTVEKCYDSLVTVTFNIKSYGINNVIARECDEFTFTVNDSTEKYYTYNALDTVTLTKEAANGCDSLIILDVKIVSSPVVSIEGDLRVKPGSDAVLRGKCDKTNANFLWSNGSTKDSIVLTNVTGNVDVYLTASSTSQGIQCASTTYVTVMANLLGLDDVNSDILNVYPNPTCAKINISTAETIKNVSVFNMMGQQVINANTANEVDLSTLTNGNYVVRIELANGKVSTRTVVLSK